MIFEILGIIFGVLKMIFRVLSMIFRVLSMISMVLRMISIVLGMISIILGMISIVLGKISSVLRMIFRVLGVAIRSPDHSQRSRCRITKPGQILTGSRGQKRRTSKARYSYAVPKAAISAWLDPSRIRRSSTERLRSFDEYSSVRAVVTSSRTRSSGRTGRMA